MSLMRLSVGLESASAACHLIDGGIMSEILAKKTYTPCRGGIPPLTRQEAEALLVQAPDWLLVDEAYRIERTFRFKNFREALTFVQKVGELAEAEAITPTRLRSRVLTKHQRCSSRCLAAMTPSACASAASWR